MSNSSHRRSRVARSLLTSVVMLSALAGGACNGGDDSGDELSASFTSATPTPGANTVSMSEGAGSGDTVTVRVQVTGVDDLFGAAFDVLYDADLVRYITFDEGAVLEQGGAFVIYDVDDALSGRLTIGVTRTGGSSGVDVAGTGTLIELLFRATDPGSSAVSFAAGAELYETPGPVAIPGVTFSGGTLVAN